jgi:hypothetical protein
MAKKANNSLKAKQAKQRKIAIGLSVALVAVLAFQGPKTLKMLKGPAGAAVATDGSDPTALPAGVEAPAGTPIPTASAGAPTPAAVPGVLANSDVPVAAGEGQLLSFEQFASKDPFQQQVDLRAPEAGSDAAAPAGSIPAGSAANPPSVGGVDGGSGSSGSSGSGSPPTGFVPTTPGAAAATATTISVNGIVEVVVAGTPFPADVPTFELVSFAKDGKSVQIGVADGSLSSGKATVKLTVGKPVTLQNTADGSRYKLELLTVEGIVPPASKG